MQILLILSDPRTTPNPDTHTDSSEMPKSYGTLLVSGSGPGISRIVTAVFAAHGLQKIIPPSLNKARLSKNADFVRAASESVSVGAIEPDGADLGNARIELQSVEEGIGGVPLEYMLCNQVRTGSSKFFDSTVEELQADFRKRFPTVSLVVATVIYMAGLYHRPPRCCGVSDA